MPARSSRVAWLKESPTRTSRTSATTSSAALGPSANQSRPKPADETIRATATTVWAAAMPLARTWTGTSRPASAAITPSVAA